ncbi:MAG: hypothetical protein ACXVA6_20895, partial [Isosphaeraceae bacterium]
MLIHGEHTITKSAFARHIGVSPSRISQLVERGLPEEFDGRLDIEKALAWCRANIEHGLNRANLGDRRRREVTEATDEAAR